MKSQLAKWFVWYGMEAVVTPEERLISEFEGRTLPTAFKNIDRKRVADGLRVRVADPSKIQQGSTSLCGPAALLYDLASRDRVAYVNFVTKLYENGHAPLGKWDVDPNKELENYSLPSDAKVEPVDWIPLASIRNTSKFMFARYDSAGDELSAPTLAGRFERWLKQTGYHDIVRRTDYVRPLRKNAGLPEVERFLNQGYTVFLFVNGSGFERLTEQVATICVTPNLVTPNEYGTSIVPTHWVVLKSLFWSGTGDEVKLTVYTWGKERSIPDCGWISYRKVKKHFFGFIAAKS